MTARVAGVAGIAAVVVFWTALFGFAAAYPGYSHSHKAISELGAFGAPHALAWNLIGFITPGLLLAICGAGLGRAIDVSGRATAVYWLLVMSGVGFAGTGVIPAEMRQGSPFMQSPFHGRPCGDDPSFWTSVDHRGISSRWASQAESGLATFKKGQHHSRRSVCRWVRREHCRTGIARSRAPTGACTAALVRNLFRLVPHHGGLSSIGGSAKPECASNCITTQWS